MGVVRLVQRVWFVRQPPSRAAVLPAVVTLGFTRSHKLDRRLPRCQERRRPVMHAQDRSEPGGASASRPAGQRFERSIGRLLRLRATAWAACWPARVRRSASAVHQRPSALPINCLRLSTNVVFVLTDLLAAIVQSSPDLIMRVPNPAW
jgi:hypothetical protein